MFLQLVVFVISAFQVLFFFQIKVYFFCPKALIQCKTSTATVDPRHLKMEFAN